MTNPERIPPSPPSVAPRPEDRTARDVTAGTSSPDDDAPDDKVDVHVIDDFLPETDDRDPNDPTKGLNHGETVVKKIKGAGGDTALASRIEVHRYNTDPGDPDASRYPKITRALDKIIALAEKDPDAVDVVNISQQTRTPSTETQRVRQQILRLQRMGVPVVIAAGNYGLETPNQLAPRGAFIVQSTDDKGKLLPTSGPGNVRAEGGSTSFAAPSVTPLLGDLRRQGQSIRRMQTFIQRESARNGGFIPGPRTGPVFTTEGIVTVEE